MPAEIHKYRHIYGNTVIIAIITLIWENTGIFPIFLCLSGNTKEYRVFPMFIGNIKEIVKIFLHLADISR